MTIEAEGLLQAETFESGTFDGVALSGNRQEIVPNPLGPGSGSVFRATVPRNDKRSEISLNRHRIGNHEWEGTTGWYLWSIYIPEDFEPSTKSTILAQWHRWQDGMRDERLGWARRHPNVFSINRKTGKYLVHFSYQIDPASGSKERRSATTPIDGPTYDQDRGRWVEWAARIRWSSREDGRVDVYRNGQLAATYEGANYLDMPVGPYFKCGIYTGSSWDGGPDTITAYFDNVVMGTEELRPLWLRENE